MSDCNRCGAPDAPDPEDMCAPCLAKTWSEAPGFVQTFLAHGWSDCAKGPTRCSCCQILVWLRDTPALADAWRKELSR